jgi:ATP-dependent Clp protease ATP-binding subunit ClpA
MVEDSRSIGCALDRPRESLDLSGLSWMAGNGGGERRSGMFERFTDRARRVVVLAQEEARMLDHNYIGTEHILLGLIHEGSGVAAKALEALGIRLEAVRLEVETMIGRGGEQTSGHIPFTPRAKKVLELAFRESTQLGHNYIGTEHILLGLVREGSGVAAQVLVKLGADLNRVRQQVVHLLHGESGPVEVTRRSRGRMMIGAEPARITELAARMAAAERWIGIEPNLHDLDQDIVRVRREKETAIDSQDFESAASLRDQEKELLSRRDDLEAEWRAGAADRQPLSSRVDQLAAEVERLAGLLREHGIEPGTGSP